MRRLLRTRLARKNPAPGSSRRHSREGSTIVVVIALLLALTFLGIVGYTIGTQEFGNATYFSDAFKVVEFSADRDSLFDWGLRQLILGTRPDEYQSALYGGHMSLLPTMFGRDLVPYNGEGVHLAMDDLGNIFVDQDYNPNSPDLLDLNGDGTPTQAEADALLELNRSAFASADAVPVDQTLYPEPDAGYTYWDNNSPFLAYVNEEHRYNAGTFDRLVIPSFHRPQYLRPLQINGTVGTNAEWYSNPATQRRVLRPHVEHLAMTEDGTVTNTRRFVSATYPKAGMNPFPFFVNDKTNPVADGIWDPDGGLANLAYDADPDGDGFNEAVYLDLGFPMQTRDNADGTVTNYVPLWAFTVMDLDALFNLNAHGNLAGADQINPAQFGPTGRHPLTGTTPSIEFLSQSNEALAVSEVNPLYGLIDAPGLLVGDTTQHERFNFGRTPGDAVELANMEWWWLLSGRADRDDMGAIQNLYPGRFGEVADLSAAANAAFNIYNYPKPGLRFPNNPAAFDQSIVDHLHRDDNLTATTGGTFRDLPVLGIGPNAIPVANTVFPPTITFPAWRHPLDLKGTGRKTVLGNPKNRLFFQDTGGGSLYNWPAYDNYQTVPSIGLRSSPYSGGLMQNYNAYYHVDDPEETILEPSLLRSDVDSVFGAGENAILHLVETDQTALSLSGRVRNLAPITLGASDAAGAERRRRFATTSWDLKSFAKSSRYYDPDPSNPPNLPPVPASFRTWEFNVDTNGDGFGDSFPPQFGGTLNTSQDPFRPALRELLQVRGDNQQILDLLRKLSINHVLDRDPSGRLRFRPLTPHPADDPNDPNDDYLRLSSASVSNRFRNSGNPPTRPEDLKSPDFTLTDQGTGNQYTDPGAQEWLARRDRQKLCRDIYVLLYTLGGGNDNTNYANNPNAYGDFFPLSGPDGLRDFPRLMAQFAVNLVDQMDPDDVITVFEYDQDLSDGWNLDDDPYNSNDLAKPGDRQVVFGVEQHQLALAEAQLILANRVLDSNNQPMNHEATEYDDQANRDWTLIELENVTPEIVQRFGNGNWQLVIEEQIDTAGDMTPNFDVRKRWLTLLGNWTITPANPRFTIGTAGDEHNRGAEMGAQITDPNQPLVPSHFRIDPDHNPNGTMGGPTHQDPFGTNGFQFPKYQISPRGNLRLDLIRASDNLYSVWPKGLNPPPGNQTDGDVPGTTGDGGDFFGHNGDDHDVPDALDTIAQADLPPVKITLRRRVNPLRIGPMAPSETSQAADNPWVEVDSMVVGIDLFDLDENDDYVQIRNKLQLLRSTERHEPLDATVQSAYPAGAPDFKSNSLGLLNARSQTHGQFRNYQRHFNRAFASLVELLSVPLYGPDALTRNVKFEDATDPVTSIGGYRIAGQMFLQPDFTGASGGTPEDDDNRWYRLFEFVEVPDRSHRHPVTIGQNTLVRSPFVIDIGRTGNLGSFYRQPGQIQLNTLRHPEVLAGLLDDPDVFQFNPAAAVLLDQTGSGHNIWRTFLEARDGIDPVTSSPPTIFSVPGLPFGGIDTTTNLQYGSRPFRNFGVTTGGNNSIEDTLLRKMPRGNDRLLFELGSEGEHDNSNIDHTIRHRMLSKVLNNSTNRSHVFLVFLQVDFFEAAEVPVGTTGQTVVRIGGKLPDSPAYRGFFVVDRSKALQMVRPDDLPRGTDFSFSEFFDFHQLILHRQTIN